MEDPQDSWDVLQDISPLDMYTRPDTGLDPALCLNKSTMQGCAHLIDQALAPDLHFPDMVTILVLFPFKALKGSIFLAKDDSANGQNFVLVVVGESKAKKFSGPKEYGLFWQNTLCPTKSTDTTFVHILTSGLFLLPACPNTF